MRPYNARQCQKWILKAYDVREKVGHVTYITKRDAATLLPIIQRVVLPGSAIILDEWRAYRDTINYYVGSQ